MKKIICLLLSLVLVLSLLLPSYADSDGTESAVPDSTASESNPTTPVQTDEPEPLPDSSGQPDGKSKDIAPVRVEQV